MSLSKHEFVVGRRRRVRHDVLGKKLLVCRTTSYPKDQSALAVAKLRNDRTGLNVYGLCVQSVAHTHTHAHTSQTHTHTPHT